MQVDSDNATETDSIKIDGLQDFSAELTRSKLLNMLRKRFEGIVGSLLPHTQR